MHHHQTIDANGKMLRRIAALLLALAGLAERAAGGSRLICLFVTWLLRPGEAIALAYLEDLMGAPGLAEPLPLGHDDAAADALRLAERFRSLAAAFATLAEDARASWQAERANRLYVLLSALAAQAPRAADPVTVTRLDSS